MHETCDICGLVSDNLLTTVDSVGNPLHICYDEDACLARKEERYEDMCDQWEEEAWMMMSDMDKAALAKQVKDDDFHYVRSYQEQMNHK